MFKYTKNTFTKGRNNDLDRSLTPEGAYLDARNLLLSDNNKFLVAENINGTAEVATLATSFPAVFGGSYVSAAYANVYKKSDGSTFNGITVFYYRDSDTTFNISAVDTSSGTVYPLFTETAPVNYKGAVVDAVVYPENGVEIVYFTDNVNELRKIRCEIPASYTGTAYLQPTQISLLKRATIAKVSLDSIANTGGNLLCGSYQVSVRFYNSTTRSYTKWSTPSAPINVTVYESSSSKPIIGYYNLYSTKSPRIRVDIPDSEYTFYDQYQVAVIENTTSVPQTVAALKPLTTISTTVVTAGFHTFYYDLTSNRKIDSINLSDIVVDTANIQTVKTLQVKNNKLFGGNIKYTTLSYDHGNPSVTGTITTNALDPRDDFSTSTKRGYFRDEVYRYYIVYFDKYYNFGRAYKLDMSAITANQFSGVNGDLKFPARYSNSIGGVWYGSVMLNTSAANSLGLTLNVTNHPSWARGFYIFRSKRIENILYQSPVLGMQKVDGTIATGRYPNIAQELYGGSTVTADKNYTTATPNNPLGSYVAPNMLRPYLRNIKARTADAAPYLTTLFNSKGESYYDTPLKLGNTLSLFSNSVYDPTSEIDVTSRKLILIDEAYLKLKYTNSTVSTAGNAGDTISTSVSGTLYATTNSDYLYSSGSFGVGGSGIVNITGAKTLDNYGQGTSLLGDYVGSYNNLATPGISWWVDGNNQKMTAVKVDFNLDDPAFASGKIAGGYVDASGAETNSLIFDKGYVDGTYANVVYIGNVTNNLNDDRYGKPESLLDVVYTGASYVFNDTELATVQSTGAVTATVNVFGGDCYVSLHQFKISDNNFGLLNAIKALNGGGDDGGVLSDQKWDRYFNNKFSPVSPMAMPVGYKNFSQVITVMLESKYNGEVLGPRPYDSTVDGRVIFYDTSESKWRICFPYLYHLGYSKEADQKVIIPYNPTETVTYTYKARFIYSDVKVYNTDVAGFDTFRVANTWDLEENYGGITKLALDGPDLVAVQEHASTYIPVDANIVEQTDSNSMAIRSSDVINRPIYISKLFGSQHIRSVVSRDNFLFYFDQANQALLRVQDKKLDIIQEKGVQTDFSQTFSGLSSSIGDQYVNGIYDNNHRHFWLAINSLPGYSPTIYDDRLGCWVGGLDFPQYALQGGVYAYGKLWLLGINSNSLKLFSMYDSNPVNNLFGTTVTPYITYSINGDFDTSKTFDVVNVYSSDKLHSMDITVENESGLSNQQISGMIIEVDRREGNYRIPTLRDVNMARLRGTRATATIYWPSTGKISLTSVITKYRPSGRPV